MAERARLRNVREQAIKLSVGLAAPAKDERDRVPTFPDLGVYMSCSGTSTGDGDAGQPG